MNDFKFLILFLLLNSAAFCQDRLFTYTYQSNVLNKGQREVEVTSTFHFGRAEYYRAFKHRLEYETGVSNHLQTAFYLNLESEAFQTTEAGQSLINSDFSMSFSNEWKYKFSDPVANALGSALYGELTISNDKIEIEAKIILDKSAGRFTQALNLVAEPEFETQIDAGKVETESEFVFEADYGLMYQLNKNFNVGFELNDRNNSGEKHGWEYSTLFGGPCFSYSTNNCWINFTFMPQLGGLHYYKDDGMVNGKVLDENEKIETRLIFSFAF